MSVQPQDQAQNQEAAKPSDKELNFRKQEEMFKRQLEQEKQARQVAEQKASELERLAKERMAQASGGDDDDHSDEPYIDEKRLQKKLNKFGQQAKQETDERINSAVQKALAEERKNSWLKNTPDFYEVMNHAQAFAEKDPELAETILSMPEGFERQKLVYKNIKALGLHKKEEPKASIQDKIDQNRRSPYYQPSGVAASPYAAAGDYTPSGMKNSYAKMQELKNRLRI